MPVAGIQPSSGQLWGTAPFAVLQGQGGALLISPVSARWTQPAHSPIRNLLLSPRFPQGTEAGLQPAVPEQPWEVKPKLSASNFGFTAPCLGTAGSSNAPSCPRLSSGSAPPALQ